MEDKQSNPRASENCGMIMVRFILVIEINFWKFLNSKMISNSILILIYYGSYLISIVKIKIQNIKIILDWN